MTESRLRQTSIFFYGEDIVALQELEPNETFVPVAQLCQTLGIDAAAQERRTRGHSVLADGAPMLKVEFDSGDAPMSMLCLRLDLVPLWLTGIEARNIANEQIRAKLELFQRESASAMWQNFRPQGFVSDDTFLPDRYAQTPAEQAYVAAHAQATLARHQFLIERQLDGQRAASNGQGSDPWAAAASAVDDTQAALLAQTVRRVAQASAERTRRNEYPGVYSGLFLQFGLSSYRRMAPARLREALEWLERWHGDIIGEPEPPPDI